MVLNCLISGVGFGISILSTISCSYYIIIISWTTYYLVNSFKSPLPWTLCGQDWNTPLCITQKESVASQDMNGTLFNVSLGAYDVNNLTDLSEKGNKSAAFSSPEEEFWQ